MSLALAMSFFAAFLANNPFVKSEEMNFLYKDPLGLMVNYTGETEKGNIPHGFGR